MSLQKHLAQSNLEFNPEPLDFEIICLSCNAQILKLSILYDDQKVDYFLIKYACSTCGSEHTFFDVLTDGYDAVLSYLDPGKASHVLEKTTQAQGFVARLVYGTEVEELTEISNAEGVPIMQLFDYIAIFAVNQKSDHVKVFEFEAA